MAKSESEEVQTGKDKFIFDEESPLCGKCSIHHKK